MSTTKPPRVTVVVPTYNRGPILRETIDSVLAQDFTDFELLVIDDGSTDDTARTVRSIPDPRLEYIRQDNAGPSAARNLGIRRARGDLVAFLDDDDRWLPTKLSRQVAQLDADPALGMNYTNALSFGERLSSFRARFLSWRSSIEVEMPSGWIQRSLFFSCSILLSTIVARKELLERAGLFDAVAFPKPASEDVDIFLRIARLSPVGYIEEPLALRRYHYEQYGADRRKNAEVFQALVLRRLDDPDSPADLKRERALIAVNAFVNYGIPYRHTPSFSAPAHVVALQAIRTIWWRGLKLAAFLKFANFAVNTVADACRRSRTTSPA